MKINQKNWGHPVKVKARNETIVKMYRKYFSQSLPKGRQYWTIGGQCADTNGQIIEGCELYHLLSERIITADQFHSVEVNKDIYKINSKIKDVRWYHKDFYQAMVESDNVDNFNPAVINFDSLFMPKNGTEYLGKLLNFLTNIKIANVMVVANFILQSRYLSSSNEKAIELLSGVPSICYALEKAIELLLGVHSVRYALENGWELHKESYTYNGTGGKRTVMGTIILVNRSQ